MTDRNRDIGPVTTWPMNQLLLTPEEAAKTLRLGRTTIYALMKSGRLRPVHIGRSCRLSVAELQRYVAELDRDDTHPSGGKVDATPTNSPGLRNNRVILSDPKTELPRLPVGEHQPGLFDLGSTPPEAA